MKLLLVSEGALDVGTAGRGRASREDGEERRGAVSVLVRRLLEEKFGREVSDWEIERDVLPRVHVDSGAVSGYPRKVLLAIEEASARECSSVAIVVDRDRSDGGKRLGHLREGRDMAEQQGHPLAHKTALGVAIEMVEAWLLADEQALNHALELDPKVSALTDPEGLDGGPRTEGYPKAILTKLIERRRSAGTAAYDQIAERARLDALERRCKLGFAPFAEEIRKRCE